MTNHTTPNRAGLTVKARLKHTSVPWHAVQCHIEYGRINGSPWISIQFGDEARIQLRPSQAVELINAIADTLEGRPGA